MQVLVTGGTGFVGSHLCRVLDERGHDVTAMSRQPDAERVPASVETVMGDVTTYGSIADAFEGQDAVVNLVALSPLFQPSGGSDMHDVVHRGGTENVIRAAEEHDVDHLVQQSALAADPDAPTAYLRAKGHAEEAVRESSLSWTIVRPSVIFGDGGEFLSFIRTVVPPVVAPLPGGGRKARFQPIWIAEFAPLLADAVEDDAHAGQTYEIGGPEKLSLADVARLVRGPDLTIVPVPMALTRVAFTVGGVVPGFPFGPDQYEGLQFDNTTEDNDVGAFGLDPADLRTLADYLQGD